VGRETKMVKPTDKIAERAIASHHVEAQANTEMASRMRKSKGRARYGRAKAVWVDES
jgi:hypothetical protein